MNTPDTRSIASMTNDAGEYTMSSITGKLVLAAIREYDYAHAGEQEAIERVFAGLPRHAEQRVLDVGCGIGGTAQYLCEQGWGQVVGVDIDANNIASARSHHPLPTFECCNAAYVDQHVTGPIDVIYSLNAYFLFADQPAALQALRRCARAGARLAIFDYVDRGGYTDAERDRSALDLDVQAALLPTTGWQIDRVETLNAEYLRWYEELVAKIEHKRAQIVAMASEGFYDYVWSRYAETRDDARAGRLGGATIYASAKA